MKKIPSLFKRDYDGNRQVYNEVVPGSEWVLNGEGVAFVKWDGTCCQYRDAHLYRRYDRKLTKAAQRRKKTDADFVPSVNDYKPAPDGWEAAEPEPNPHTGHWPGWVEVDAGNPADKYHVEAHEQADTRQDGTYELLGPKVQGNPHQFDKHLLTKHDRYPILAPRDFDDIKEWLDKHDNFEGIVWHHPDGRMVKIKRKDFGLDWPPK